LSEPSLTPLSCLFCRIAAGEENGGAALWHADETVAAFVPREPAAAFHILVVPRTHVRGPASWGESRAVGRAGEASAPPRALRSGADDAADAALLVRMVGVGLALARRFSGIKNDEVDMVKDTRTPAQAAWAASGGGAPLPPLTRCAPPPLPPLTRCAPPPLPPLTRCAPPPWAATADAPHAVAEAERAVLGHLLPIDSAEHFLTGARVWNARTPLPPAAPGADGDAPGVALHFHWPPWNSIDHLHLHVLAGPRTSLFEHVRFLHGAPWTGTPLDALAALRGAAAVRDAAAAAATPAQPGV
jgi:hypothetical protein